MYSSQIARGVMYGFALSGDPKAAPVVLTVEPHGAADKAGLRPGDRLQSISGFAEVEKARPGMPNISSPPCSTRIRT